MYQTFCKSTWQMSVVRHGYQPLPQLGLEKASIIRPSALLILAVNKLIIDLGFGLCWTLMSLDSSINVQHNPLLRSIIVNNEIHYSRKHKHFFIKTFSICYGSDWLFLSNFFPNSSAVYFSWFDFKSI